MRQLPWVFALLSAIAIAACGGGDDEPDAAPPEPTLGQSCVPSDTDPQGDCAPGFICLDLNGTSGPFCTIMCVPAATDPCPNLTDYVGPGAARCFVQVTDANGMPLFNTCAVVCDDAAGDPEICMGEEDCNGDCPGDQACNGELSNANGVVATICI